MRIQPPHIEAPEPGKFNINVFWQTAVWYDIEAKPRKVSELDCEYARNIYYYAARRWERQWDALHPLFPLPFTPLMQTLKKLGIEGRAPNWRDRLRYWNWRRKYA